MPAPRRIDVTLHEGGQSLIVGRRRRHRHDRRRTDAGGRAPLHLETARRRSPAHRQPRAFAARPCRRSARSAACASSSRTAEAANAWAITVEGGAKTRAGAGGAAQGTRVEVRDLFFATPARLKFLKSPRTERELAVDVVRRLAMAYPEIAFTVTGDDERVLLRLPANRRPARRRLAALLGRDFADNALAIEAERGGFRLTGLGRPADVEPRHCRATSICSSTAGRCATNCWSARCAAPIRISWRATAIRSSRCSSTGRRTRSTSTSIRPRPKCAFAMPRLVRGLIVGALRHALAAAGHRASTTVADARWRLPPGRRHIRAAARRRARRVCRVSAEPRRTLALAESADAFRRAPMRCAAPAPGPRPGGVPLGAARGAIARDLRRGADRDRHRHRRSARRA